MRSDDEAAFRAAIEKEPLDLGLRAVFADWLEENDGDPMEVQRQRNWDKVMAESMDWMREASETIGGVGYDGNDGPSMPVEELLEHAESYEQDADGYYYVNMGNNENYNDVDWEEFWEHYYILTGKRPKCKGGFFSCSC